MGTRLTAIAILAVVSLSGACIFSGSSSNSDSNTSNNVSNDPDPELCGNGRIDPGETCDPCDSFKCPSEGCSIWAQTGSAAECNLKCELNGEQTACGDGDNCCPEGCSEADDSDCSDACGNGVLDEGELCDPCPEFCDPLACGQPVQSGDPSTCDLLCEPAVVQLGCCGGEFCDPETMACIDDVCVPRGCLQDTDCSQNETCVNGVCERQRGCEGQEDCLPWEVCQIDNGNCVDPDSCDGADNEHAWCARHAFTPGEPTFECYSPDGSGRSCIAYMPIFCTDDNECSDWEACVGADDCQTEMCECRIPDGCMRANDPEQYCIFQTGDPNAVCGNTGCE